MNSRDPQVRPGIDVQQYYRLDMPQVPEAARADIYDFKGRRAIGEPTKYTIQFTHPSPDLSRSDFLNRMAAFVIQPPPLGSRYSPKPEAPRRVQGVITTFAQFPGSRDQTIYEVTLESRLALLRNTPRYRHFLEMKDPEIIAKILKEHEFNHFFADAIFDLYRQYRKRPIVMQWGEDDLTFIQRLCRRAGIWFVSEEGKHCERVRFGDDFSRYTRDRSKFERPYREPGGLLTSGQESVGSLVTRSATMPAYQVVRSFSPEQPSGEPIEQERESERVKKGKDWVADQTTRGKAYAWGMPYVDADAAKEEVMLRHEAARAAQVVYTGTCDMLDIGPACVLELTNRELPDARHGILVTEMTCSASRKEGYRVTFTAIPADRQYRMPLLEETWPRIPGVVTGTIASTTGYTGPYLDREGRYIVNLHTDRDTRSAGLESCPMRLAKPFAGPGQTGFHFGLEPGTVVTVAFLWGNPDLPYISGVLHTARHTDPIVAGYPWGSRHTIRTRSNNTFQMDDRAGQEHIKTSTDYGKSQLNLGYIVNRDSEQRGAGFELRTDDKGAIRSAGLLLTAYVQPKAGGKTNDTTQMIAQFDSMRANLDALAESARTSNAEVSDLRAENQWLKDELADLKRSVIALSAPDGIGMATPGRMIVSTGKDTSFSTASIFSIRALKRILLNAYENITLYAGKLGIKVYSRGPVLIQSQASNAQVAAKDDVTISTVDGSVYVRGKKELTLECGGAYIRLKNGQIFLGAVHGIETLGPWNRYPASQMHLAGPAFSPRLVPLIVSCRAWDGSSGRLPTSHLSRETKGVMTPPAHVPASPQAPTTKAPGTHQQYPAGSPDSPNADNDSAHEPKSRLADDASVPMKLAKSEYCDWHLPAFRVECTDSTETGAYYGLHANKEPYPATPLGIITDARPLSGYRFDTGFELSFDPERKVLCATVRVQVIPVELFKCDPYGTVLEGPDGKPESVYYDHDSHSKTVGRGVDVPWNGWVMKYRGGTGPRFNHIQRQKQIEAVLNEHKSVLILNGCSRGATCGARVKVVFKVELLVSLNGQPVGNGRKIHKVINLFPKVYRADAGSWGEVNMFGNPQNDGSYTPIEMPFETNVIAHECGHLFNFPDEYWANGGWMHKQYIKNQEIDFALGDANVTKQTWQLWSATNVMGGGAYKPVGSGAGAPPSAAVHPYYLEYIRRHFCELTGEEVSDKSKPVWRRWRIGYEA
ncbi:type VI secretion system secreted protein VgrG [Paraburkholderia sacchari]|uniref:type VI secretion system tip protein VgrG n=1 Tax=Paraburkholderia sacchari TaxID=159450 RepID=UPI0039A55A51